MEYSHRPVMLEEICRYLDIKPGGRYIDGTLGGAGYTRAISEAVGPEGLVVSFDLDQLAIENAAKIIEEKGISNIVLIKDSFRNLETALAERFGEQNFDGIVFDFGLSSAQLADEDRGFSFKGDRPLNMAFGEYDLSTADILNRYPLLDLTRIFREYGEEKQAYRIAKAIVEERRRSAFKTTKDLTALLEKISPRRPWMKIDPATRIFQALRMETNDELGAISEVLPQALSRLVKGGRFVTVSFHSGEDRLVKNFFRSSTDALEILTKKPLVPSPEEAEENPRSRSAKLRAAEKR
jgi:16S rRNA (cytosine1402-N4)-methyltransferase